MEEQRKVYQSFLTMHAHKGGCTEEPTAHVLFYRGSVPAAAPLVTLSRDDVADAMNKDAELVRWLLKQMSTYDCRKEKIVALVFDKDTVLSDVMRVL